MTWPDLDSLVMPLLKIFLDVSCTVSRVIQLKSVLVEGVSRKVENR